MKISSVLMSLTMVFDVFEFTDGMLSRRSAYAKARGGLADHEQRNSENRYGDLGDPYQRE
jgi:hypothetical protein